MTPLDDLLKRAEELSTKATADGYIGPTWRKPSHDCECASCLMHDAAELVADLRARLEKAEMVVEAAKVLRDVERPDEWRDTSDEYRAHMLVLNRAEEMFDDALAAIDGAGKT